MSMQQCHTQRPSPAAQLSALEESTLIAGVLLIGAAAVALVLSDAVGGLARVVALGGFLAFAACASSRAARLFRADTSASLPTSVARIHVRARPARAFSVVTIMLALALPLGAAITLLVIVEWAWLPLAAVVLFGGAAVFAARTRAGVESYYMLTPPAASALLERLCMRADMRPPELVVEGTGLASAWTAVGRIHITPRLLDLLDGAELEAVLAHEVAHLANRDAAVMDVCSAPSRVLLAFAELLGRNLGRITRALVDVTAPGGMVVGAFILAVFCVPPAFVVGWVSRLSVLGMSRARELSADAAAATLTGRPSALASALMKLDRQRDWAPRSDLRQAYPNAVLCIVGTQRSGLVRLFSTHPPTALRVKRLEALEARMQAGPYAA